VLSPTVMRAWHEIHFSHTHYKTENDLFFFLLN
jgi:hypothetical protein